MKPQKLILKRMIPLVVLTFVSTITPNGLAEDQKDRAVEDRFHQIYQKYNQQPTDREVWDQVLIGQKSRLYQVQDKDTLWGVSQTLFADANFWPKIWAQNTLSIDNPHEIDPNMEIEFYPGTFDDAPSIAFVHMKSNSDQGEPQRVRVLIPPQNRKSKKLIRQLPESLPLYQYAQKPKPKKEWKISARNWGQERQHQFLSQFVTEKLSDQVGRVVSTEFGDGGAYQYQTVYVQLNKAGAKKLKVMQVIDRLKKSNQQGSHTIAQVVQVQGELTILEEVKGRPGLYQAIVSQTVNPIQMGALVFEGELDRFLPTPQAPAVNANAAPIVGGPLVQKTELGQIEDYLYLAKGAAEGFEVGQILNIYSRAQAYRLIGKMQIVHVAAGFSTGFILQQNHQIEIGDYVGGEKEGRPSVLTPIEQVHSGRDHLRDHQDSDDQESMDEMSSGELEIDEQEPEMSNEGAAPGTSELDDALAADSLDETSDLTPQDELPPSNSKKKTTDQEIEQELDQSEDLEFEEDSTGEELSRENETNTEVPQEVDMSGDQQ